MTENNAKRRSMRRMSAWLAVWLAAIWLIAPHEPLAAAAGPGTSEGGVKHFDLYATDGYLTLPDGEKVYVWGYSLQNKKGTAGYPAPTLEVEEGDEVEVTLANIGPAKEGIRMLAHTIHWHGLDTDQRNDGVPHTSPAIQVGESFTYRFKATHAGTYFYHCHVDTVEHLQMGMHGTLIVRAKGGEQRAWTGGPAYDKEYVFHLNEIDPVWHKAVEEGKPYDRTAFHPRYWTINGKAFPDTMDAPDTMIEANVGETVLVRLINAGYEEHPFHLHGHHFQVIATDGRPLPQPMEKDTINIGPGERYDILIRFTQSGEFPFHSHKIVDNTNNGVYPGGLHTMTSVKAAAGSGSGTGSGLGAKGEKVITLRPGDANVQVDGHPVALEVAPMLIDGSTYVPLRFIGNQFGAAIEWIGEERSVVYTLGGTKIQLWIDRKQAVINGQELSLETPPVLVDGTSLVPLRFVSEKLGADVGYDDATKTVTIRYAGSASAQQHNPHDGGASAQQPGQHAGSGGHGLQLPGGQQANPAGDAQAEGEAVVSIGKSAYSVRELKIKTGTKVTWVNDDTQIHTVTELNNKFKSGNMLPKGKWSHTFDKPGTFVYYCSTHPSMEAKVIVE